MRILQLHEWTEIRGGAETYIRRLHNLVNAGQDASWWIGINEYGGQYAVTEFGNSKLFETRDLNRVLNFLGQYMERHAIEVINIHNIFNPDIIRYCLSRCPVIKTCHSPVMVCPGKDKFWRYSERACNIRYGLHCFWHIYSEGCSNRHPRRVWNAWKIVNFEIEEASLRYRRIVVMSSFIEKGLLECGVSADKIVCNPYFTSKVDFLPSIAEISKTKRIFFAGRLVAAKGPHLMIRAVANLLRERPDVHLDIVGEGLMREELRNIVAREGIQSKVIFHGWLHSDGVKALLQESYLVVFPSIYPEAFGIVGIEAMMCGKPVVGFDVGGVSSWLNDSETGFLIQVRDVDTMEAKIRLLLEDTVLYAGMRATARMQALAKFTPETHMKVLNNIYASAID